MAPIVLETVEHTICRVCRRDRLVSVLDYGLMPLAGGFLRADDPGLDWVAPLELMLCPDCRLLQLRHSLPPDVIFKTYSYSSSAAPALVRHFRALIAFIGQLTSIEGARIVDVGCNDGILLNPLHDMGAWVVGVDPSDVAREASTKGGWPLVQAYLTPDRARDIVATYGYARIVTACNVLAHTDDVHSLMGGIKHLLAPDGIAIIEVQYQGSLLELTQFDTVYHEHTCYHSLTSLITLIEAQGMVVRGFTHVPTHSGSLRVFASLPGYGRRDTGYVLQALDREREWDYLTFAAKASVARHAIGAFMENAGLTLGADAVAAYGAAGRATILLNWCAIDTAILSRVVDASPLRVGRFVPGVRTPIVSVEDFVAHPPKVTLITAWNYATSIRKQHPDYRGKWVVPLPVCTVYEGANG